MKYSVLFQLYQTQWSSFNDVEAASPEEAFNKADDMYCTGVEPDEEEDDMLVGPVWAEVVDEEGKVVFTTVIQDRP